MSFTSQVKQEVSLQKLEGDEERAKLSALIQLTSSLSISSRGMCLVVTTENNPVARNIFRMLKDRYQVDIEFRVKRRMNLNKNQIFEMRIYGNVTDILTDLGIYSSRGLLDKPLQKIVSKDSTARAYLCGAFMADGSVNSPETASYHLEIKAENESHAQFLVDLMERFYIPARTIERRKHQIVYIKSAEKIADFLRVIGADENLMEFENERIARDFTNNVQRLNNVDVANEMKSMKAANAQLKDIEILDRHAISDTLDEKLRDVIAVRKENPEASLNELAQIYEQKTGNPVSKSGLKHRFVKLHELACKAEGIEE